MIAALLAVDRLVRVEPTVRVLSLVVDVAGWSLDRFADVAEPTARWLADKADHARWLATGTRCVP